MSDSLASQSDAELLKRFAKTRDERVFEELMERYGRLVMTICLRALQNQYDAEDVFQATFLVLAEKAGKIKKRESLPSWLSGVAHRLSMNLARKRHRKDLSLKAEPEAARDHFFDLEERFNTQAMDEELHALPEKYRDALVRFYFLNQTSRQIAEALGITQGSADGRIKRGRQELRIRLAKRGVALGSVVTFVALSAKQASAALAPTLMQSTLQAAVAKGSVSGLASATAAKLAGAELMKTSSMVSSIATVTAVVVLLGLGMFGANAAFARAVLPGELPINTVVESVEAGTTAVKVAQEEGAKAVEHGQIKQAIKKLDVPAKSSSATADSRRGSDVYGFKQNEIDERIKEAKEVAPDARFRKRSDRMIVDGTAEELAKVENLFAKSGVEPISQMRSDPAPSLFDRLKAAMGSKDKTTTETYVVRAPLKAGEFAAVLKRFKVGKGIKTDVTGNSVTVTASPGEHDAIRKLVQKLADQADHPGFREAMQNTLRKPPVIVGDMGVRNVRMEDGILPDPRSVPPTRVVGVASPPKFATAKLSVDGKSVMVNDPNAANRVTQTYTVRVPYQVTKRDADGKEVKEMRFRDETRTRTVLPNGKPELKKVYRVSDLKIATVSGNQELTTEVIRLELDGSKPVVILQPGEQLSDVFKQVLKPDTMVITLPKAEANK